MSTIDEIKARLDIVDLVSETVQLRHSGKNYTGFCPFHANTRTPAFVVFPETGTWRCFGQCNEGGDIFGFVMKREGCDFSEALRFLAERAGVQLKPPTPEEQVAAEEGDRLRALLEEAVVFYRHNLLNTPAGKAALDYLRGRGLKEGTIEAFGLGYAPNAWEAACTHFRGKGYTDQDLLDAGIGHEREGGAGIYDRFRHRVTFPIRDERGRMAGFGARILDPNDVPKFINSPQTALFDKGRLLYGLDQARKAIRVKEQAVIVEGYLDVIALHQADYANSVSPMGTALTEHQLYLLKRFSRRIVLALDSDAAGDRATLRGLQIARQALDHEREPVFDARGLLGFEARLQADIRVTTLPAGMDPDDIVNRDPAEWQRILENARPVVLHVMETLASNRDLEDPKVKTEIASQVLPLIEDVPSPVERETYRQKLARLLRVDERALLSEGRSRPVRARRGRSAQPAQTKAQDLAQPQEGRFVLEGYCLGVLLRRPDLIYRIDRAMQEARLDRLSSDDFQTSDHQTIFLLIKESLNQDEVEPLVYVMNRLSMPLMDVADGLLERTGKIDLDDKEVFDDILRSLLDLRRRNLRQNMDHLRYLMEEAQYQGDPQATEYQRLMHGYIQTRDRLDRAHGFYTDRPVLYR
jgi:DNA primase